MTWQSGVVPVDGIRLAYHRTGGDGPVLVLLHGITDDGLCWTRVARDLEGRFDIVMPDARGHGASDGIASGFTLERLAADVAGLLAALDIPRALVFGHSLGAITAAALAAGAPGLVDGLVLEDPPLDVGAPPAGLADAMRADAARWSTLPEDERRARAAERNPAWDATETDAWADAKARVDLAVLGRLDALVGVDWRAIMAAIECPGLLVTGDPALGAIVTPALAAEAVGLWRSGRVVRVEGARHTIHRDRWDEAMAPIRAFLLDRATGDR